MSGEKWTGEQELSVGTAFSGVFRYTLTEKQPGFTFDTYCEFGGGNVKATDTYSHSITDGRDIPPTAILVSRSIGGLGNVKAEFRSGGLNRNENNKQWIEIMAVFHAEIMGKIIQTDFLIGSPNWEPRRFQGTLDFARP